jgi:hypothetical protein
VVAKSAALWNQFPTICGAHRQNGTDPLAEGGDHPVHR